MPVLGATLLGASVIGVPPALAEPESPTKPAKDSASFTTIEARLLGSEEGHLVLDAGGRAGVSTGDSGELFRPVEMRHPVTKRVITDRYRIGSVRIVEALQVMSFADPEGDLREKPRVGDIVVMRVERPEPPPPPLPPPGPKKGPAETQGTRDVESDAVAANARPAGAHFGEATPAHFGEATPAPRAEPVEPTAPPSPWVAAPEAQAEPRIERFVPPKSALSGAPLELGVEVSGHVNGVVLQSRHTGEVSYAPAPMRPAGTGFWVATIGADRVRAPRLEYFIDVVRADGATTAVVGDAGSPVAIEVRDAPKPVPPPRPRSTASVYMDYADYNRLRGNDRAWQTEGFLGMRFAEVGLRALRTGFGVYRGVGGSVNDLDVLGLEPRSVGLTYGYLEGEAGISSTFSIIARGALGLNDDGVSGGAQLHVRIGSDLGTNLTVGGEVLGGVGLRGIFQVEFAPQSLVPAKVRVEVTNEPGGEVGHALPGESTHRSEVAGRLVGQVGYRFLPPLVVFVRGSAEGRTIDHFGPGFGGGATFEW